MKKIFLSFIVCLSIMNLTTQNVFAKDTEQQNFEEYKRLCDLNDGLGCVNLGVAYAEGEGVQKNDFKAFEAYQKSCNLNHGLGCVCLGTFYGMGRGTRQNDIKAKKSLGKACDLKEKLGCDGYAKLNK